MPASYTRIFQIALPLMLTNMMVPLIGLVDTGVIGNMGKIAPLAAVGLGATIISTYYWLFLFLGVTTTAAIARAYAAGKHDEVHMHLGRALLVALTIGGILIITIPFWVWFVPVAFDVSDEVRPDLQVYLAIRLFGAPLAMLRHIAAGYLIAGERTRLILFYEIIMQGINLTLDLILVLGLGFGVAGVATASITAEMCGALFIGFILRREIAAIWYIRAAVLSGIKTMGAYLRNGGYIFGRSVLLQTMILTFSYVGTQLGEAALAINAVLMIFLFTVSQATDGFAVATEVLTAGAIGRRNVGLLRTNIFRASLVSFVLAFAAAMIIVVLGDKLFALISTNEELRVQASHYINWIALAAIVGVFTWSLDGVFFGANLGREMMMGMIIGLLGFILALAVFVPLWGNHGLWLSYACGYATRALGLAIFYPRIEREMLS